MKKLTITTTILALLFLSLGGCDDNDYKYICANGTPADGNATVNNITKCIRCNDGYGISNSACINTATQWTNNSISTMTNSLRGVHHSGTHWMAVGNGGKILTSTDGTSWSNNDGTTTRDIYSNGNQINRFLAVHHNGTEWRIVGQNAGSVQARIAYTTSVSNPVKTDWNKEDIASGSGAGGGISWGIYSNSNLWVTAASGIYHKNDSNAWTSRHARTFFDVHYGNSVWVTVGTEQVSTSGDGRIWTDTSGSESQVFWGVHYANSTWIAVGSAGTSSDSFYKATINTISKDNNNVYSTKNNLIESPTGDSAENSTALFDITYGNGVWVAIGENGTMYRSVDGTMWTSQNSGTTNDLYAIHYANNLWVAVGEGGTILTAP